MRDEQTARHPRPGSQTAPDSPVASSVNGSVESSQTRARSKPQARVTTGLPPAQPGDT